MMIYRVESNGQEQRELILKRTWGEGDDNSCIVTLAHQLLKQHTNYIYLEDRLVVYANQTLFDLRLPKTHQNSQTLPIELISKALSKIQVVLVAKERMSQL